MSIANAQGTIGYMVTRILQPQQASRVFWAQAQNDCYNRSAATHWQFQGKSQTQSSWNLPWWGSRWAESPLGRLVFPLQAHNRKLCWCHSELEISAMRENDNEDSELYGKHFMMGNWKYHKFQNFCGWNMLSCKVLKTTKINLTTYFYPE